MTESTTPKEKRTSMETLPPSDTDSDLMASDGPAGAPGGLDRRRTYSLIVIALAVLLLIWLVARDNGDSSETAPAGAQVTAAQLKDLPKTLGHPIFWLGPKAGTTYELIQSSNGNVYVRYLPAGVAVGAKEPYLTVATYPFPGAYPAIQGVIKDGNSTKIKLAYGGIAESPKGASTSVHAAYPGVDYQIEVYDPTPGTAAAYVGAGQLKVIGNRNAGSNTASPPKITTPAALKKLATSLGHPIYWAGVRSGSEYELQQNSNGNIYIRYLPEGAPAGSSGSYTTVATYPYPQAYTATQGLAGESGATVIKLKGGGIAVISKGNALSAHVAYPGVDYQVEVYDPSPAALEKLVSTNQIESIG